MRFELIKKNPRYPAKNGTQWWWDTWNPLYYYDAVEPSKEELKTRQLFHAYEVSVKLDPNAYHLIPAEEKMHLLFVDEKVYYMVCNSCYKSLHKEQDKRAPLYIWERDRMDEKNYWMLHKRWCEICDPIFGLKKPINWPRR